MSFKTLARQLAWLFLLAGSAAVLGGPVAQEGLPAAASAPALLPELEALEGLPQGLGVASSRRSARPSAPAALPTSAASDARVMRAPGAAEGRLGSMAGAEGRPGSTAGAELRDSIKQMVSPEVVDALKELRGELSQVKNSLSLDRPDAVAPPPQRVAYQADGKFSPLDTPGGKGPGVSSGRALLLAEQLFYEMLPWALGALGLYAIGSGLLAMLRLQQRKQVRAAMRKVRRRGRSGRAAPAEPAEVLASKAAPVDEPLIRRRHGSGASRRAGRFL